MPPKAKTDPALPAGAPADSTALPAGAGDPAELVPDGPCSTPAERVSARADASQPSEA